MIFSVINTKGGVGKTVSSIHLGASLAARGRRVLLIDADLQAGLTAHFDLEAKEGTTTADVLSKSSSLDECVLELRENLFLVPGSPQLERAERNLTGANGGEVRLRDAIDRYMEENGGTLGFDYVLIDCPSGWGPVTRNAVLASQGLIVPINSEPAAITNAVTTIAEAEELCGYHRHKFDFIGVLLVRYRQTKSAREVERRVKEKWPDNMLQTYIRQVEKVNELTMVGLTAMDGKHGHVSTDYAALAEEIESREVKPNGKSA